MSTDPRAGVDANPDEQLIDDVRAYLDAVDDLAGSRAILLAANRAAKALAEAARAALELTHLAGHDPLSVALLERLRAVQPYALAARELRMADTGAVLLAAARVGLVDQALPIVTDHSRPSADKPPGRPCTALRRDGELCRAYALPWGPRPLCAKHATPEERVRNAERRTAWQAQQGPR